MKILGKIRFLVLILIFFDAYLCSLNPIAASSSQEPLDDEIEKVNPGFYVAEIDRNQYFIMEKLETREDIGRWEAYVKLEEYAKENYDKTPSALNRLPQTYKEDDPTSLEAFRRASRIREAHRAFTRKWAAVNQEVVGRHAFSVTLSLAKRLHEEGKPCDIWIAYSRTENEKPEEPYVPGTTKVELAVTVTTSPEAPFTTHMGIHRSIDYLSNHAAQDILKPEKTLEFPVHGQLSINLHAFAAKVMLRVDPKKSI